MDDVVREGIENALNVIVNMTESSRNMKEELKQTIFETVSTLRNPFVKLKDSRDGNSIAISELEECRAPLCNFNEQQRNMRQRHLTAEITELIASTSLVGPTGVSKGGSHTYTFGVLSGHISCVSLCVKYMTCGSNSPCSIL
jgi:hypothetical protein